MEISEILKKYATDKNSGHHYGEAYDTLFSRFDRNAKLNILEIGTQKGESLLAWKEYFPNAKITGIDVIDLVPNKHPEINYVICDIHEYKTDEMFDIVIDDGSHWLKDVVHSVAYFCNRLKLNGAMVIEDVQKPHIWIPTLSNILAYDLPYNKSAFFVEGSDCRSINNQEDDYLLIITNIEWK